MNFFEILGWMGILCLAPIPIVVAYNAIRGAATVPSAREGVGSAERPEPTYPIDSTPSLHHERPPALQREAAQPVARLEPAEVE